MPYAFFVFDIGDLKISRFAALNDLIRFRLAVYLGLFPVKAVKLNVQRLLAPARLLNVLPNGADPAENPSFS